MVFALSFLGACYGFAADLQGEQTQDIETNIQHTRILIDANKTTHWVGVIYPSYQNELKESKIYISEGTKIIGLEKVNSQVGGFVVKSNSTKVKSKNTKPFSGKKKITDLKLPHQILKESYQIKLAQSPIRLQQFKGNDSLGTGQDSESSGIFNSGNNYKVFLAESGNFFITPEYFDGVLYYHKVSLFIRAFAEYSTGRAPPYFIG